MTISQAGMTAVETQVHIEADPQAVWAALTSGIGDWWPAEFYAGGEDGKRRFVLEPQPGGRMYESWEDGGGIWWGQVVCADPARRLQVIGYTFPNWGGPSQWYGTWDLEAKDGGTQLRFSEHAIGRIGDDYGAEKTKGWNFLWDVLKATLEGRPAPAWAD